MFSSMLVWVFCGFSHYTVTCGRSISRPKTSKEQQKCRFISDFWKFCCCSCQGSHSFIKVKTKTDYIHNLSSSVRDYILELGQVPENPKTQPEKNTNKHFKTRPDLNPKKFSKPDLNPKKCKPTQKPDGFYFFKFSLIFLHFFRKKE